MYETQGKLTWLGVVRIYHGKLEPLVFFCRDGISKSAILLDVTRTVATPLFHREVLLFFSLSLLLCKLGITKSVRPHIGHDVP